MRIDRLVYVGLLLLLPLPASAAQSVSGSVSVSGGDGPLAGARVVLVDVADSVVAAVRTDFEGRFLLAAHEPGDYRLLVDRPGYVSTLSELFHLSAGVRATVDFRVGRQPIELLLGSMELEEAFTNRIAERCGVLPDGRLAPSLVGLVTDLRSGIVLPGVRVSLEWSDRSDGIRLVQSWTDAGGVYAICDPPQAGRPRIRAETLGLSGDPIEVEVPVGRVVRMDVELPLTEEGTVGRVLGRVADYETGLPLSTVEVRVRGADLWTLSDRNGNFRFDSVPPGTHVLEIDRVGYAHREKAFRVVGRAAHQVDVALSRDAIVLEPITVAVRSRNWYADMTGLQDRMAAGIGEFFTRPEMLRRGVSRLTDVLYGVPGLVVQRVGQYAHVLHRTRRCSPSLYLDGLPHRPDPVLGLDAIRIFDLEAVEVYRRDAETPAEFLRANGCGAVVAWTRRGR